MTNFIIVDKKDNVATALRDFKKGEEGFNGVKFKANIPSGHKFALKPIYKDEFIIKYAHPIACASCDIDAGEWVHIHNCVGIRGRGDKE